MRDREPQVDRVRRALRGAVVSFVHGEVQEELRDGADLLAVLGLARAADLLAGQLVLFDVEKSHLAPVLGRTLIEIGVYVQDLVLEPDAEVDGLNAEADDQHRRHRSSDHSLVVVMGAVEFDSARRQSVTADSRLQRSSRSSTLDTQVRAFCEPA